MEINELMILTDNEIDYGNLSDEELKELALGDELFIATSALGELENRNSNLGAEVAWEILSNSKGDRYLQAAALETLFQGNPELALDYMKEHAQKCDRYILKTAIELMIENPSDFKSGLAWSVSGFVRERIKNLKNGEEFIAPELIDTFLNLFDEVENLQLEPAAFSQKSSEETSLKYEILFHPECLKEFLDISRKDAVLIARKLYLLQTDPKGFTQVAKLQDANLYKLRAGEYRIIFTCETNRIILLNFVGKSSKKQAKAEAIAVTRAKEDLPYNLAKEFLAEVKKRGIELYEIQESEA